VVPILHRGRRPPTLVPLRISTTWEKVDPALPDGPVAPTAGHATAVTPSAPRVPPWLAGVAPAEPPDPIGATAAAIWVPSSSPSIVTSGRMGMALRSRGWDLITKVNLPKEPGRYRLTLALRNGRGSRPISPKNVPAFKSIIVSVTGPYQVGFEAPAKLSVDDRAVTFGVTNAGTADWGGATGGVGGPSATGPHLMAVWVFPDRSSTPAGTVYVDLEPGASAMIVLPLTAMPAGATGLRLDLVGPDGRPIAERGGRATLIPIQTIGATQKPT
jgi:hypothetical protein